MFLKKHPFGNEYHTVTDGDFGAALIWHCKLHEGKDHPGMKRVPLLVDVEDYGAYSSNGKIVTHDSGFCVTAGIFELHNIGIYGQALMTKQGRYWPHNALGDFIDEHFYDKEIVSRESLMQTINGISFLIHCQKEEKYLAKIMSTHRTVNEVEEVYGLQNQY